MTTDTVRADIVKHVGDDYILLGLLVDLEAAILGDAEGRIAELEDEARHLKAEQATVRNWIEWKEDRTRSEREAEAEALAVAIARSLAVDGYIDLARGDGEDFLAGRSSSRVDDIRSTAESIAREYDAVPKVKK